MRLTGLLALLLFVLIVFFAAPAASFAQTANIPSVTSDKTDPNPGALLGNLHLAGDRVSERPLVASQPLVEHNGDLVLRESVGDDFTCLTMRTYIMKRDEKDSDATHLVRKVKCTPARKFNFKTADIRSEDQNSEPAKK
jgi:hypothetical protein